MICSVDYAIQQECIVHVTVYSKPFLISAYISVALQKRVPSVIILIIIVILLPILIMLCNMLIENAEECTVVTC